MKKLNITIIGLLLLLVVGCVPMATLEPAAPANGSKFTIGAIAMVAPSSDGIGAGALPYVAYAWGNGSTEFSISSQLGFRGAVKQLIVKNASIEGGLTIPWTIFLGDLNGSIPFTADLGLLYDINNNLTISARGMYGYLTSDWGHIWMGATNLTYHQKPWLFEGGVMVLQTGGVLINFSGGYYF